LFALMRSLYYDIYMKIAQIVCVFPPYRGGIGTMAHNHAKSLAEAGNDVTVFTPQYDQAKPALESRDGFQIARLNPWFTFGNAGFCPSIYKKLEGFDVIHLHYPCFGIAESVLLSKKIRKDNVRLVVTYHMDVVGGLALRPVFILYSKIILPMLIRAADKVIVTSNDYAAYSQIRRLFYRLPNKFVEISPEVDVHHFRPELDFSDLLLKHNLDKSKDKILLFVGGLDKAHYFKGINFLINAFKVLRRSGEGNYKLLIVGDGDLRKKYENQAKASGYGADIIFAGSAGYESLPRYYNLADVLILPSVDQSEAFGIVVLEALACGTPAIVSRLPGVRTAVEEGVDGYTFAVRNEGELASRVNELLSDEEKRKSFGRAGRSRIERLFTKEIIRDKLVDVYSSISNSNQ